MSDLTPILDDHEAESHQPDRAVSAFLYLGDKLRAFYLGSRAAKPKETQLPAEGADALLRTIQGEIIPRLMLAHQARAEPDASASSPGDKISLEDQEEFLAVVLRGSAAATRRFIEALLLRGVSQDTLFLELLGNTARRLGQLWEEDRCTFADVTVGLCRLHQVLREWSLVYSRKEPIPADGDAPRILLTTACGDQHVFGVVMVAEFFRRAKWRVWSEPGASRSELCDLLSRESFDVLGLSAACSSTAQDVCDEIDSFRKATRNREIKVLVGGRLFVEEPDLVARSGADGAAFDAKAAPAAGWALLERPQLRC